MDAKTKLEKTVFDVIVTIKDKIKHDLLVLSKTRQVKLENKDLSTLFAVIDQSVDGVYNGARNNLDKALVAYKEEVKTKVQDNKS